jgi:hypothetical protein
MFISQSILIYVLPSHLEALPHYSRVRNIPVVQIMKNVLNGFLNLYTDGEFQARDLVETISAFGSPVSRTYTLHVANSVFPDGKQKPSSSHILGWDNSASGM